MKRPALSFDRFQGASNNGLSIEQLMLQLFTEISDLRDAKIDLVDKIFDQNNKNLLQNTTCRYTVTENAVTVEAQAFIALLTLLKERNLEELDDPFAVTRLNSVTHQSVMTRLKSNLQRVRIVSEYQFIWRPTMNKDATK